MVAGLPGWHRPVFLVDDLHDELVFEQVRSGVLSAMHSEDAGLGRAVELEPGAAPCCPDGCREIAGGCLTRGQNDPRGDVQASLELREGKKGDDGGVGAFPRSPR